MNPVHFAFMYLALSATTLGTSQAQDNRVCAEKGRRGYECKPLRDCPVLLNILQNIKHNPQDTETLRKLICGFDGREPRLCCPPPRPPPNQRPPTRPETNTGRPFQSGSSVVDVTNHPSLRFLLPQYCGPLTEDNRIIMGEAAGLYEFPWMALLGYQSATYFDYRCAGSLINKRYVLTAAHCMRIPGFNLVSVRLGEYDLSRERDCEDTCAPPVQEMGIQEAIPHPQYSTVSLKNDIALIRLSSDVNFNEATMPVCLPIGRDEQSNELSGQDVTVTGWGKTENAAFSSVLLKADIPMAQRSKCAEDYRRHDKDIDDTQLCVGTGRGKDSCKGDSGGPMQVITARNTKSVYVQYGIVSYGPSRCGNSSLPGIYTRVGSFMPWILDTMRP